MTAEQFARWKQLHEIVKMADSMSEIYRSCKEMVALQDGYTINIIPLKPEDHVSVHSLFKDKDVEKRKDAISTIRESLKEL